MGRRPLGAGLRDFITEPDVQEHQPEPDVQPRPVKIEVRVVYERGDVSKKQSDQGRKTYGSSSSSSSVVCSQSELSSRDFDFPGTIWMKQRQIARNMPPWAWWGFEQNDFGPFSLYPPLFGGPVLCHTDPLPERNWEHNFGPKVDRFDPSWKERQRQPVNQVSSLKRQEMLNRIRGVEPMGREPDSCPRRSPYQPLCPERRSLCPTGSALCPGCSGPKSRCELGVPGPVRGDVARNAGDKAGNTSRCTARPENGCYRMEQEDGPAVQEFRPPLIRDTPSLLEMPPLIDIETTTQVVLATEGDDPISDDRRVIIAEHHEEEMEDANDCIMSAEAERPEPISAESERPEPDFNRPDDPDWNEFVEECDEAVAFAPEDDNL